MHAVAIRTGHTEVECMRKGRMIGHMQVKGKEIRARMTVRPEETNKKGNLKQREM